MPIPDRPKIYHIVHLDRLASITSDGFLWSDAIMAGRKNIGTTIGMHRIKDRRLNELKLSSYPDLHVGQCTPFYFCPRSVMLYLICCRNEELSCKDGQEPVVHLEADLYASIAWAQANNRRWAFTLSNAGAYYFEDRADIQHLGDINWNAVQAQKWGGNGVPRSIKEGKQAEFLVENAFPWDLFERIGVFSQAYVAPTSAALQGIRHRPTIEIRRDWYY